VRFDAESARQNAPVERNEWRQLSIGIESLFWLTLSHIHISDVQQRPKNTKELQNLTLIFNLLISRKLLYLIQTFNDSLIELEALNSYLISYNRVESKMETKY
jgi:IS4 transposase